MVARYGPADVERLMADPGIVRSRAKIEAAVRGAGAYLRLRDRGVDFADFCWETVDGRPVQNAWDSWKAAPTQTPASLALSKRLKAEGFGFCGPVIVYAFMQATGMVNDHQKSCFRRAEVQALA